MPIRKTCSTMSVLTNNSARVCHRYMAFSRRTRSTCASRDAITPSVERCAQVREPPRVPIAGRSSLKRGSVLRECMRTRRYLQTSPHQINYTNFGLKSKKTVLAFAKMISKSQFYFLHSKTKFDNTFLGTT